VPTLCGRPSGATHGLGPTTCADAGCGGRAAERRRRRLYLINSPVVRAEPLRFKEEGVRNVIKDVFLPWYNAYRFFVQNAKRMEAVRPCPAPRQDPPFGKTNWRPATLLPTLSGMLQETGRRFLIHQGDVIHSDNVMDQWVLASTQSLVQFVIDEMKGAWPAQIVKRCPSPVPDAIAITSSRFAGVRDVAYRLYTVVPRLVTFINDLTNWYVRLNRARLKV